MAREDRGHYIGICPYKRLTNCDKLLVFGGFCTELALGAASAFSISRPTGQVQHQRTQLGEAHGHGKSDCWLNLFASKVAAFCP